MNKKPSLEQIGIVDVAVDWKVNCTKLAGRSQGFQQAQPILTKVAKTSHGLDNVQVASRKMPPLHARLPEKVLATSDTMGKKLKVLKRFGNELTIGKKIKKIKQESKLETGMEHLVKSHESLNYETLPRQSAGKSYLTVLYHKEYSLVDQNGKGDGGAFTISPDCMAGSELVDLRNIETAQFLDYLLALALNPLRCLEHNIFPIVLQFFLQFGSFVCQKNPILCTLAEAGTKSLGFNEPAKSLYGESAQDLLSASKPPTKRLKPDNYGRTIWDSIAVGAEEMSSEGLEKVNQLESLSAEKKVGHEKPLKSQGRGRKETDMEGPLKPIKNSLMKVGTQKRFQNLQC